MATQKNLTQLLADTASAIVDNTSEAITPAIDRVLRENTLVSIPITFFNGVPGAGQNVAAGYLVGKSRVIDFNTQIEYLYVSGTTTAVWSVQPRLQSFDVTFNVPADIQAMGTAYIEVVPDLSLKIQVLSAMIVNLGDGGADYDFTGYAFLTSGDGTATRTFCRTLNSDGTPSTNYNGDSCSIMVPSTNPGSGPMFNQGVYLGADGGDATVGDHTIRVVGTYVTFPT